MRLKPVQMCTMSSLSAGAPEVFVAADVVPVMNKREKKNDFLLQFI